VNPKIDAVELTNRHTEYQRQLNRIWHDPEVRGTAAALIRKAQEDYTAWFAERGVDLVF
jgi:hypothetical protein